MYCKKCGKEIDDDSKFCAGCGEALEPESKVCGAQTDTLPEATPAESKRASADFDKLKEKVKNFACAEIKNYKNFKNLSTVQKIIRVAVPALILVLIFSAFGGGGSNSYVVKADSGSTFGNVTFDLTFEEFIDKYNACIAEDEEFESVAQIRYLKASDFEKTTADGVTVYSKNMGYTFGVSFKALAKIFIYVNQNTGTIQFVEYKWKNDGYNTEDAETNYYFTLPATIFSMLDDSIAFPYDGNASDYIETYDEILDNGNLIAVRGDSFYKYMTADDDTHSIVFYAATKNSDCFKSNKGI